MELNLNSTSSGRERQESLEKWFRDKFGSLQGAGRQLGLSGKGIKDLCSKDRVSTFRWRQLDELGVPANLLPEHGYTKPGPKAALNSGEAEAHPQ